MKNDTPRRILLIEEPGREALEPALASQDRTEVREASDLKGAFDQLKHTEFQVIVVHTQETASLHSDLSLLIQTAAEVPVVIVSETPSEEFALNMMRAGAQDFVVRNECETTFLSRTLNFAIERHRLQREMRDLSLRDELTGLYNRRGFLTLGTPQLLAANRLQTDIGLIYFDLDNLKLINDTAGHPAGDEAIRRAAKVLLKTMRSTDTVARMGGDEFAALALGATPRGEAALLARLRRNIEAQNFASPELSPISLSIGVAFYRPEMPQTMETLMQEADAKMYSEKRAKKAAGVAR